ncbi:MAG: alpha/beta fold hydrolase [Pseudomonadota bacterium]
MPQFHSDEVDLEYLDEGDGIPVLMIHGFASRMAVNWINTLWVKTVVQSGRRAIAFDNRGHGDSRKFYDPSAYEAPMMAEDALRLFDHLRIKKAHCIGYSMGARITAFAAMRAPERFLSVTFGGLGENMILGIGGSDEIAQALEAENVAAITHPQAVAFRVFADQTKSDRKALAACIRASRQRITADEIGSVETPALVVVGEKDDISGSADGLATLMPNASAITIPGKDHMSAVGDRTFKAEAQAFWDRVEAA